MHEILLVNSINFSFKLSAFYLASTLYFIYLIKIYVC